MLDRVAPRAPLRVLVVNNKVRRRSGTEIVTRDLARGLRARGFEIAILTEKIGWTIAREVRESGAGLYTSISDVPWRPDVIHANHPDTAIPALEKFPDVPVVAVCHDPHKKFVAHPLPMVVKAFGVSHACRQRAAKDLQIPLASVGLLPNGVDVARINRRGPLPERPVKWLFVAEKDGSRVMTRLLRSIARSHGASLKAVGPRALWTVKDLPNYSRSFDLAFASARSAMECAAAGLAVCITDPRGVAGLLTPGRWAGWREENLGKDILKKPVHWRAIEEAIAEYDPEQAHQAASLVRSEASLNAMLDMLEEIYAGCIALETNP